LKHNYSSTIQWTGNNGTGTNNYTSYSRSFDIICALKEVIAGSSDPAFRGEKTKHNPEDLLLTSLSSCHMLWYLHFCSIEGIVVVNYTDNTTGIMIENSNGSGHFTEVTLNPIVIVTDISMQAKAIELHSQANKFCFIANSVNFPVLHNVVVTVAEK
jgi:organic hydroperoxide reductase OsmC/OhrA